MPEASEILQRTKVVVSHETYALISLRHAAFSRLMESSELSPRLTAPFFIFSDNYEVTMLLDETDFGTMRHALRDAKTERGFRLVTFDIELDLNLTGYLAEITHILAAAKVPIVAISAFSRDHLLIKQNDLAAALKALGPYVGELC